MHEERRYRERYNGSWSPPTADGYATRCRPSTKGDNQRMIVEFIGSTGSGKTRLIAAVHGLLEESEDVVRSSQLMLGGVGLSRVEHATVRNIVEDLNGLAEFPRLESGERAFLTYAAKRLAARRPLTLQTMNYLRSAIRVVGVLSIASRRGGKRIVLVDEGTVLSAYGLLVYGSSSPSANELARFADIVPLPDLIIYVRAPLDDLLRRTAARPDRPRELRGGDPSLVSSRLERAITVFDQLVSLGPIRDRVVEVENAGNEADKWTALVDRVGGAILEFRGAQGS